MTPTPGRLFVLGVALIAAGLILAAFAGCGYYPEPEAPVEETRLTRYGMHVPAYAFDRFDRHETQSVHAFAAFADVSPERQSDAFDGWTVVIRADGFSEKYGRAYFTDDAYPGWLLWGMTDFATRTIYLADVELSRAVLTHEFCHVLFPPPITHADWPALGCDVVERDVAEALALASGVYDGSASDGVYVGDL